ncbi:hypothetical protein ACM46_20745 [Chryseobacterium angstadtii]|uniref:TonB-dependent receptor-like beta-barrel domain-containing protein n=1 Tax=Chryseobacterium angstadtii TaxID=558151 RepID=A0A0J7I145_9FLAO|nr:TonB-dependent receptor [Chryseobacterium angstadtii]KMQ59516.1 hypothetical protein ACM46_20745 [Chryseobacterium angstadtii]
MKKLTTSVLLVVLTSSFGVVNAQQTEGDSTKTQKIGEVIITGVLNKKKTLDAQTNPVVLLDSKQLMQAGSPNAIQALAAKAPNMQINNTNSSVNGTYDIKLRGARTINGSTSPLVVIDGVISSLSVYQQMPSNMIDGVTIMLGTQGAAVYGPAGLNGALIVTTKKGLGSKKVNITVNSNISFDNVAFVPYRQDKYGQGWYGDRVHVENGAWGPAYSDPAYAGQNVAIGLPGYDVNGGGIAINPDGDIPADDAAAAIYGPYAPRSKNNVKEFFTTGTTYDNSVTISTGSETAYAALSLNRVDKEFIVKDDTYKKTFAMFKGGFRKDRWDVDGSLSYSSQSTSTTNPGLYRNLLQASTEIPIVDFRNRTDTPWGWNMYYASPYWTMKHERNNTRTNLINGTLSVSYKFNDHISLQNTGSLQLTTSDVLNWNDGWVNGTNGYNYAPVAPSAQTSSISQNNSNRRYIYDDVKLNFDYKWGDFGLNGTLGYNVQETYIKTTSAGGTGIKLPGIYQIWNLANPSTPYNLNNDRFLDRKMGVFADIDIAYKDYLHFNITGRQEWSSKLLNSDEALRAKYSYFFPSAGFSFLPLKAFDGLESDTFSRFVIKGSWARIGNDPVSVSAIEQTVVLGTGYPFNGNLSFVNNPNPSNISGVLPEFTNSKELNLGLGFFKDALTLDVNVYQSDVSDLISNQIASSASGISSKISNIGDLRNRGYEISLGIDPFKGGDFSWDARVAFGKVQQRITALNEGQANVPIYEGGNIGVYAIKGEDFPQLMGTGYMRDDQGRIIVNPENGNPFVTNNFIKLGKVTPDYTINFSTNIRYKNWSAFATMDYRKGGVFYAGAMQGMSFSGHLEQSASFDRTQGGYIIPNSVYLDAASGQYVPNTDIKSGGDDYNGLPTYYGQVYGNIAENFVLDATAFKVRELGVSYSFGKSAREALGVTNFTIGVFGRNLFYKYAKENKGYADPETSIGSNNNQGVTGVNQYPAIKTIGVTTTINF